jgi:hypothetical protein
MVQFKKHMECRAGPRFHSGQARRTTESMVEFALTAADDPEWILPYRLLIEFESHEPILAAQE